MICAGVWRGVKRQIRAAWRAGADHGAAGGMKYQSPTIGIHTVSRIPYESFFAVFVSM